MKRLDFLLNIQKQQTICDNKYFKKGIFPSFRRNEIFNIKHFDDNLFFSVSIVYILNSYNEFLSDKEKLIIKDIKESLTPVLHLYTNKPERHSYNFWQKRPNKHFPNGLFAHRFKKFVLPDDIDTTSLTHLVLNSSLETITELKTALIKHSNSFKNTIKTGHKNLKHYKAYSTWYGNNMPIEFDVCVLSNYLLLIKNLEFNFNDKQTIDLIKNTIKNSLYFTSSFLSAPEYPKTDIILYHLSRLAACCNEFDTEKSKLITDIKITYSKTKNEFSKLILFSSLKKLTKDIDLTPINLEKALLDSRKYWWFTAGFLSGYSNSLIQKLAPFPLFHFRFYCNAFNQCLVWEYMVLQEIDFFA